MMDAIGMLGGTSVRTSPARVWTAKSMATAVLGGDTHRNEPHRNEARHGGASDDDTLHGDARPSVSRTKPLREAMPEVAGFIDTLRDVFGRDSVDASLSLGLAGEPTFFAAEAGHEVGTRVTDAESDTTRALRVRDRYYCNGCDGRCVGTDTACTRPAPIERDARGGFDTGF